MNKIPLDKKTQKSILNLKYTAYLFVLATVILGFVVSIFVAFNYSKIYPEMKLKIFMWVPVIYIVAIMIIWGILDVLKLLNNLYVGNIFTYDNSEILKRIDKKIIFTIIFSVIINVVMFLASFHHPVFLLVWLIFIIFLIAGHILVNPLALLVEKSADLQIEMELTI